jgi:hypothetical protein
VEPIDAVIAGRRHLGEEREPLGTEVDAAAGRACQRLPGDPVKAVAPEHEVARHLAAVGQYDHRSLGEADLGDGAPERDLPAADAERIDQVGHQQLLRVDVMPEARQRGIVEDVTNTASAKLARLGCQPLCVQPAGESVAIEQRHRARLDQPGSSPGPNSVLRHPLEHRALDAGADQQVGSQ